MKQFLKVGKMIFLDVKMRHFFLISAQNIDCGDTLQPPQKHRLIEAVLTCPHNICFRAKIRKMNTPVNPSYIKVRCKGVFISRTCLHDTFSG